MAEYDPSAEGFSSLRIIGQEAALLARNTSKVVAGLVAARIALHFVDSATQYWQNNKIWPAEVPQAGEEDA